MSLAVSMMGRVVIDLLLPESSIHSRPGAAESGRRRGGRTEDLRLFGDSVPPPGPLPGFCRPLQRANHGRPPARDPSEKRRRGGDIYSETP